MSSTHFADAEVCQALQDIDRNTLQIVKNTIPNCQLYKFDNCFRKLNIGFSIIDEEHYTARSGAINKAFRLHEEMSFVPEREGDRKFISGTLSKDYVDKNMVIERGYSLFGEIGMYFYGCDAEVNLAHVVPDFKISHAQKKEHTYEMRSKWAGDEPPTLTVTFCPREGWIQSFALIVNFAKMPKTVALAERIICEYAIDEQFKKLEISHFTISLDSAALSEKHLQDYRAKKMRKTIE